jgi:glycosyltransferase involved in cell wall biosynthesis
MRILLAAEARLGAGGSGAERVLDAHVAALRARGHQLVVLCREGRADGVVSHATGWSALTPWRALTAVGSDLSRGAIDAIVLYHPLPGVLLGRVAHRAHIPVLAIVLSPWAEEYAARATRAGVRGGIGGGVRGRLERGVLARATRVCALSRFMADRVATIHRLPASAIRVVPGGVERDRFAPAADRQAVRKQLGLPVDGPLLFCLRNLEPRMGVEVLLDAMPAVLARHPTTVLVVGGDGPLAARLRARAARLGLGAAVRFCGFVPEVALPAHYAAADASIVPTRALEGFGLVTLESLACGTPVIGTPVGATPELLTPLDRALLADAPTAEALARALLTFLARDDRDALAARCRAHTEAYAWDRIAARLEVELAALRAG